MEPRKSFLLRIDPALWRELERWAADDLRSLNGQIEWVRRRRGVDTKPEPDAVPEDPGST